MTYISPSVLSADFARLGAECLTLERGGADWIHCDVMDGVFVPNISFGMPVVESIRNVTHLPLDVHLMIDRPERYVQQFAEAGADIITIHLEATQKVSETLRAIHACGKKAGISIRPSTPVGSLTPYRGLFDMVLIMSVEPGFGGQQFLPESVDRVRRARQLFPDTLIEVDGGINADNAPSLIAAGADVIVAGTAIMKESDRAAIIARLRSGK